MAAPTLFRGRYSWRRGLRTSRYLHLGAGSTLVCSLSEAGDGRLRAHGLQMRWDRCWGRFERLRGWAVAIT